MTAEQVGPAQGKPRTIVALEAAVNDWLPVCGFRHGPEPSRLHPKRPEIRLQSALFCLPRPVPQSACLRGRNLATLSHLTGGVQIRLVRPPLRAPKELLGGETNVLRDLAQQGWRDVATGVEGYGRPATVWMSILLVRAPLAYLSKPEPLQMPRDLARLQRGQRAH